MKELLEFIAKEIVENPDAVEVTAEEDDRGMIFHLRVDPDDMGKVIGRGGRTARAIRTVMKAAGTRAGIGTLVEIVE